MLMLFLCVYHSLSKETCTIINKVWEKIVLALNIHSCSLLVEYGIYQIMIMTMAETI